MKPLLLDTFCKAGGADYGYHLAGFEVVGVDIEPQPRYPFEFHQVDALEFIARHGNEFDVIHASPPCQGYSLLSFAPNRDMSKYPKLINNIRTLLIGLGSPYIIENVPQAPLDNPVVLCGTMFGLRTHKHRAFETNPPVYFLPAMCNGARVKPKGRGKWLGQYYGDDAKMVTVAGHQFSIKSGSRAMGINWMTRNELAEAIPPAYTKWLGERLLEKLSLRHSNKSFQATCYRPDF